MHRGKVKGEVYRAQDRRLGRDVAIKVLPAEFSADAVRKQRFEREAKAISSLNHPNIYVLYEVGSQDGMDYPVMECVEGESLVKRLEKGALPIEQVLKFGAQIAGGLEKAHRAGMVHWDLKPGHHADVERREIAKFWIGEARVGFGQPGDADGGDARSAAVSGDAEWDDHRNFSIRVAGAGTPAS